MKNESILYCPEMTELGKNNGTSQVWDYTYLGTAMDLTTGTYHPNIRYGTGTYADPYFEFGGGKSLADIVSPSVHTMLGDGMNCVFRDNSSVSRQAGISGAPWSISPGYEAVTFVYSGGVYGSGTAGGVRVTAHPLTRHNDGQNFASWDGHAKWLKGDPVNYSFNHHYALRDSAEWERQQDANGAWRMVHLDCTY